LSTLQDQLQSDINDPALWYCRPPPPPGCVCVCVSMGRGMGRGCHCLLHQFRSSALSLRGTTNKSCGGTVEPVGLVLVLLRQNYSPVTHLLLTPYSPITHPRFLFTKQPVSHGSSLAAVAHDGIQSVSSHLLASMPPLCCCHYVSNDQ
jgi:hypothetical protein